MKYPSFEDVKKARETLKDVSIRHWFHDDLFTWKWWLLLAATILPWVIWIKYHDKARTLEILCYGLFWGTIASAADVIGGELLLWGYPDKLLPMVPPLLPADITVIPVSFMFIYQYAKTWKIYMVCSLLLSGFFSFVIEPIFIKLEMFALHNWTHTSSFIGFFILSLIPYYLITKLNKNR